MQSWLWPEVPALFTSNFQIPPDLVVDRWPHMVRAAQPLISR
jgi:hypothetical protein